MVKTISIGPRQPQFLLEAKGDWVILMARIRLGYINGSKSKPVTPAERRWEVQDSVIMS
jgi:hypothetical protein